MSVQTPSAIPPGRATCVLMFPRARRASSDAGADHLIASLERRQVDVIRCHGPHHAMSEVVLQERSRRAGGAASALSPLVVVLLDPDAAPDDAADLFDAACSYAPHAVFWQYLSGPAPRLVAYNPGSKAAQQTAQSPPPPIGARGVPPLPAREHPGQQEHEPPQQPLLRLTHDAPPTDADDDAPPPAPRAARNDPAPPPPLLSEEELAMLLGDGPFEPPPRRSDAGRPQE
jgi:hypothetical protein